MNGCIHPSVRAYQHYVPQRADTAYIDPSAVVIGRVVLGHDCSIWPTAVLRGDVHYIQVGSGSNVQDGSILHNTHPGIYTGRGAPLIIGNYTTIGHKAMLHGCTVGSQVLVGMSSTVLDGAVIEDEVMLGAHSLVRARARLKSGFLYAGNPAVQKRVLMDEERQFLRYSAEHYVRLKQAYTD